MKDTISVIIPVYNAELTLDRCIQSVVSQTYKNLEIILINDGSKDRSFEICSNWVKKDSRVKFFNQMNCGVSCARNLGLDKAAGEYVAFVDADDWLALDMYEKLINKISVEKADTVFCHYFNVDENHKEIAIDNDNGLKLLVENKEYKYFFVKGSNYVIGSVWRCLFKKNLLNDLYFNENIRIGEDCEFLLRYFARTSHNVCVDEKLYYYRCSTINENRNKYFDQSWYIKTLVLLGRETYKDLLNLNCEELACAQKFRIYLGWISNRIADKGNKIKSLKNNLKNSELCNFNQSNFYKNYMKICCNTLPMKLHAFIIHKGYFKLAKMYYCLK